MLRIYQNDCKKFNFNDFRNKKSRLKKNDWLINTDNGLKLLQSYQYEMLKELYTIFSIGHEPNFIGSNQSGAIYGNWKLENGKLNNMNQLCNIFMVYSNNKNQYEFYHINIKTNKIRKIIKKEYNITRKSLRYKPY